MPEDKGTDRHLIIFKLCSSCNKNYEFVKNYWDFEEDENCTFCSQGETIPEIFTDLEYITVEDLDTYTPPRIQDCFSQIDKEIPKEIVKPSAQEPKHLKHKKKKPTKDKQQNENKELT